MAPALANAVASASRSPRRRSSPRVRGGVVSGFITSPRQKYRAARLFWRDRDMTRSTSHFSNWGVLMTDERKEQLFAERALAMATVILTRRDGLTIINTGKETGLDLHVQVEREDKAMQ